MEEQNPVQEQQTTEPELPAPPQTEETPKPVTKFKKRPSKKLIIIIVAVVLALAGAVGAWFYLRNKNKKDTQSSQPAPVAKTEESSQKPISKTEEDQLLQKFLNPTTGETWLATPKKLPAQGYYANDDGSVEYYEVGKRGANTIIMSVLSMLGDDIRLYEKGKDGKVVFIARPDADATYNEDNETYYKDSLVPSITIDKSTHYDSLTMPRKLDYEQGYFFSKPTYPGLGDYNRPYEGPNPPKLTEVKKVGQSSIKKNEFAYDDTKLTSIGYFLLTPINTVISLEYNPLETDLKDYQWQRGNSSTDKIRAISRGCGGRLTAVSRADSVTDADVQEVGKSPSGLMVYELKNPNHPLVQKAYEEFIEFNKDTPTEKYANISKADFIKEHGIVLHKDKFSQWLVYAREELRPAYGCAKPVVYLYPTKVQTVNIQIGADVKISDPLYNPKTGWNVLARPDGLLTTNGTTYDSLFWEGPGIGTYPSIVSGTVVPRDQAMGTIHQQLSQLGLNAKESADFAEYWQDKLPNKPYVRLTWLTTAELNNLAPLKITPKPDTLIRVFLDFSGLEAPIKLPAQNLQAIPRRGFTVVEWGGLSPTRLF